jgi:hypothetical protein
MNATLRIPERKAEQSSPRWRLAQSKDPNATEDGPAMQVSDAVKLLRIAAVPAILIIVAVPALVSAKAQATPAAAPAPSPVQLQPYTAPDQSASAGVPAGWKVTDAVGGAIAMSGQQGEAITLGNLFVAHDGPFQLGQKGPGGAFMTMPSSARLTDKLVMILQQIAALNGKPVPQIKFLYAAPLQMQAAMGQCGMFVAEATGGATPGKGMGIFCSLPDDSAQFFKSVLMIGSAPSAIAVQTAPAVEAVFKSYTVAPNWLQKMFSPYTLPASGSSALSGPELNSILLTNAMQQRGIDVGFACADANILGEGPRATPRECGGYAPNP